MCVAQIIIVWHKHTGFYISFMDNFCKKWFFENITLP